MHQNAKLDKGKGRGGREEWEGRSGSEVEGKKGRDGSLNVIVKSCVGWCLNKRRTENQTVVSVRCRYGKRTHTQRSVYLPTEDSLNIKYSISLICVKLSPSGVSFFTCLTFMHISVRDGSSCKGRSGILHMTIKTRSDFFAVFGRWFISPLRRAINRKVS